MATPAQQSDFIATYGPLAQDISAATGLDASVVLGQAAQETGWGQHVSGNNIFGVSPGGKVAAYPDVPAAAQAYVDLIQSRYSAASGQSDPMKQAIALQQGGYNPDPTYGPTVAGLAGKIRSMGYGAPPAPANDAFSAAFSGAAPATSPAPGKSAPSGGGDAFSTAFAPPKVAAPGATDAFTAAFTPPPTPVAYEPNDIAAELGYPVAPVGAPDAAPSDYAMGRIGSAIAGGFGSGPLGASQATASGLAKLGLIPDPATGAGNPLQRVNDQYIVRPMAALGDLIVRGIGGAAAGVAQAGQELGAPEAGRTVAALPEAFAGSPGEFAAIPHAAEAEPALARGEVPQEAPAAPPAPPPTNPLATAPSAPANSLAAPAFVPPGTAVPPLPRILQLLRADDAVSADRPEFVPPETPQPPNPLATPAPRVVPAAGAPNPLATGAAERAGVPNALTAGTPESVAGTPPAAPEAAPALTPRQAAAARATSEMQRLMAPVPAGIDTTEYVPGVNPTLAELSGDADASVAEKRLRQSNPTPFDQRDASNNDARTQYFDSLAGTPTDVDALKQARSDQATKDLTSAFGNKAATDAQPVVDTIENILTNPRDSENPAVQKFIAPILDQLHDADGNLKTDPENLYGIRESVNQQLSRASQAETPTLSHVAGHLNQIKSALDGVIEQGAPGYQAYLKNFAEASKPIDTMEILQDYKPGLTNGAGRMMTFGKVDRMMKDLVIQRAAGGLNQAKSIDDATMGSLFNLHSDLKRANNVSLGKAAGSDTSQMLEYGKKMGLTAAHGLAAHAAPVVGNAVVHYAAEHLGKGLAARSVRNALNPNIDKLNSLRSPPQ